MEKLHGPARARPRVGGKPAAHPTDWPILPGPTDALLFFTLFVDSDSTGEAMGRALSQVLLRTTVAGAQKIS